MVVSSVREDLERDLGCLDLLSCIYGLNERDRMVYQVLIQTAEGLSVDDVADRLDCERSTAYRSISRLLESEVVVQEQVNYEHGGYYYVYRPRTPEEVAHDMQRLLNDWYAVIGQLIQEFEDQDGRDPDSREGASLEPCS